MRAAAAAAEERGQAGLLGVGEATLREEGAAAATTQRRGGGWLRRCHDSLMNLGESG
jgi:hypothetical protein